MLCLLVSFGTYAQKIRPYAGISGYINSAFEQSGFGDLKLGVECSIFYYLKPEIEVSYMLGALEEVTKKNEAGLVLDSYQGKVSAVNYSLCSKILLGNKNDGDGYVQILPKYTYSNIQAQTTKKNEHKEKVYDTKHSLGIGLGYVIDFSEENPQTIALNLYFNNIDLGYALNKLELGKDYKTSDVIGFGVNYYFSLKNKNK